MSSLNSSFFIMEPGKTKTIFLETSHLEKSAQHLKTGDALKVRSEEGHLLLEHETFGRVGEITQAKLFKKISYSLSQGAEVQVLFINAQNGGASFLVKSSLPIFSDEKDKREFKPYARAFAAEAAESAESAEEKDEDQVSPEETNPLSGLTIIDKEKDQPLEEE